jgi:uncharacterized protein
MGGGEDMPTTSKLIGRNDITEFLAQKRLAMIGVSRKPRHFSRGLFREFKKRGHECVCVNPSAFEIEGTTTYPCIQDITPRVEAAILMVPPTALEEAVHDCAETGVKRIWIVPGKDGKPVKLCVLSYCESAGISVIHGVCPHMFLPNNGFPHNLHGFVMRIAGHYPK